MSWEPRAWREELLWMIDVLNDLPYKPNLRFCDYRIMDHFGLSKHKFKALEKSIGRARKEEWGGWRRDTLIDSVRSVYYRGHGHTSFDDVVETVLDRAYEGHLWSRLPFYLEVWFEAEAMEEQFKHYLGPLRITTRPFRGDYSIPLKHRAAKDLQTMHEGGKEITIIYFGDWDEKGRSIPESALKDIRRWGPDFTFVRGGLNIDQVELFDLPENPARPGQWQWEGLDDDNAKMIIFDALDKNIDLPGLRAEVKRLEKTERKWKNQLRKLLEE